MATVLKKTTLGTWASHSTSGWLTVIPSLLRSEIKDIVNYTATRPHLRRPSAMLVHVTLCDFMSHESFQTSPGEALHVQQQDPPALCGARMEPDQLGSHGLRGDGSPPMTGNLMSHWPRRLRKWTLMCPSRVRIWITPLPSLLWVRLWVSACMDLGSLGHVISATP